MVRMQRNSEDYGREQSEENNYDISDNGSPLFSQEEEKKIKRQPFSVSHSFERAKNASENKTNQSSSLAGSPVSSPNQSESFYEGRSAPTSPTGVLQTPTINLQRSHSLPIIKISDFDDGNIEFYGEVQHLEDDFDQDDSPYETQEFIPDETTFEMEERDVLQPMEDEVVRRGREREENKKKKWKKDREERPSSSVISYKQYKTEKQKKTPRRKSFGDVTDILNQPKKVNFNDVDEILNLRRENRTLPLKAPPTFAPLKEESLFRPKRWNGGEYIVSEPQGDDLYRPSSRPVSLPPLEAKNPTGRRSRRRKDKRGKSTSVLYPYIHGLTKTVDSGLSSAKSSNLPSAATVKSKDDSRIQYEFPLDTQSQISLRISNKVPDLWRARKIKIFRNGDRYFPGIEYTFRIGRDVLNMEGLCDKISNRIGLPRGARFIFALDGTRKYRLEELEDGGSYVAASDRKFANLAYNKRRPGWNSKNRKPKKPTNTRSGSPIVKLAGKRGDSSDSGNSTGSNNGKPSSREGRTIKIISNGDKPLEVSVLVNMKTVQSWEDVVADLGQVLKLKGGIQLFTSDGQQVKSFSQFKNNFAALDTFYLQPTVGDESLEKITQNNLALQTRPNSASSLLEKETRKKEDEKKPFRSRGSKAPKSNLRKYSSEPILKETSEETEEIEIIDPRPVNILIDEQKRVFYPPKSPICHNPTPPRNTLILDWVFGYRGADTRKNLWVISSEELLYFVAAVAILYDRKHDGQRHYTEHTEDIQCLALHPTRDIVASAQRATRGQKMSAHVRVWSLRSLNTLHVLGERELGIGVMSIAFSRKNRGQFLLAVDADQEHLLSVWTWENERILGKVATHQDFVYGACFHPLDNNLIILYGKKLLSLWTRRKDGIFSRSLLLKESSGRTITSLEFSSLGDLITGDSEGHIAVWSINLEGHYYIKMEYLAHNGPVSSLQQLTEGTILSGGEKDRRIVAWDADEDFEKVEETRLPEIAGGVRTLYPQRPGEADGNIYVGTTRNMILEGSLQRKFNQIVFGHSKQLWGLGVNQNDGTVATAGYDRQIVKWRNNKLDWRIQAQGECVSVAIHPYSTVVATGTIDGHLIILNALTGMHVLTIRVCGSPISCMAYNLTGETLAAGSQNGSLYLFRATKDGFVYTRYGRMSGFQPISCVDWSESGVYLQTVTSDSDLTYWSLRTMNVVKNPSDVRNETWVSQTCPLGYMIHGIWAGNKNAPTQLTVDRNENKKLLATGDTEGYLRLYRYPVLSPKAGYHKYKVYTSYLSCARFSPEEDYLYTIGGTDAAFMRWRIE